MNLELTGGFCKRIERKDLLKIFSTRRVDSFISKVLYQVVTHLEVRVH